MEGLFLLKDMLLPGENMCKIDLNDGYFAIPVSEVQEVYPILEERPFIRVLLPLLWAFSSSSGFYKVIKSPHFSLLRKLNVRIITYLDEMLLMASSL